MKRIGLDIGGHKQTPVSSLNLEEFDFVAALIPICIDQNLCAHFRCPIDMIVHG